MRNYNLIGVFLGIIAVFFLGVILLQLKSVLLPFALAILLSVIFKPIVIYLKSKRVPTAISLVGVLLAFFMVLFLLGWFLYASTSTMVRELPRYEARIDAIVANIEQAAIDLAVGLNMDLAGFTWSDAINYSSVTSALTSGAGTFFSFVGTMFLVLLFMMFILAGSGDLAKKIRSAFPEAYADRIAIVVSNVDNQVRKYLVTKTLVSLGTGTLTFLVLLVAGVDFPLVWGFLAFVLNYIPNFGSLIAVFFPIMLAGLQFESLGVSLLLLVILTSAQTVMGNVVEPRLMGFSLNLSPLFILVSLIFWGWLWGLWGMVLAVPLTATLKILFENLEPLKPLSILMSDWTPEQDAVLTEVPVSGE